MSVLQYFIVGQPGIPTMDFRYDSALKRKKKAQLFEWKTTVNGHYSILEIKCNKQKSATYKNEWRLVSILFLYI